MRILLIIFVFLLIFSGPVFSLGLLDIDKIFSFLIISSPGDEDYFIFSQNYMRNILPEEPSQEYSNSYILIHAAKGEKEPAQFVVDAKKTLNDVQVYVSDLNSESGIISKNNIDIRIVRVMEKRKRSDLTPTPENMSLVPEILDYNKPLSFSGNKQYWLDVNIPESISPGIYKGTITVQPSNSKIKTIELRVEVYPFSLVEFEDKIPGIYHYHLHTCSHNELDDCSTNIDRFERFEDDLKIMKNYGLRGVSIWEPPKLKKENGKIVVDYTNVTRMFNIIKDIGFTEPVPYHGLYRTVEHGAMVMSTSTMSDLGLNQEEQDKLYTQMVRELQEIAKENGWSEILFYPIDEADTKGEYEKVEKYCDLIREADPKARIFLTGGNKFFQERKDLLDKYADIWNVGEWNPSKELLDYCRNRLDEKKECWTYVNQPSQGDGIEFARRSFGYWFYQYPYTHQYPWTYRYVYGDPFNDKDGNWSDWMYTYPDPENKWKPYLPSLKIVGVREGIDDLKYITTLEKTIEYAPERLKGKKTEAINYLSSLKNNPDFKNYYEIVNQANPNEIWKLNKYDEIREKIASLIKELGYNSECPGKYLIIEESYSKPLEFVNGETACCNSEDNCVGGNTCYSNQPTGATYSNLNPSGNDNYAHCYFWKWLDCDQSDYMDYWCGNLCGPKEGVITPRSANFSPNPNWNAVYSGENGVGEYPDTSILECCGDDSEEYYINNYCSGYSGPAKCCNSALDKIDLSGNCVASCPTTTTISTTTTTKTTSTTTTTRLTTTTIKSTTTSTTIKSTTTQPTTTTTLQNKFTFSNFSCSDILGVYECSIDYNNQLGEEAIIVFLFLNNQKVVSASISILNQGQGTIYFNFYCSTFGQGDYKVSWRVYRGSDEDLSDPLIWVKSNEFQEIKCK